MAQGQVDPTSLKEIEGLSHKVGAELSRLGINVNFAPCVDILTEPANVAIGDRAFGIDVEPVVQRSTAWLDGLQSSGVLGCLKHFPGQGDAKVDTHAGQARMDLPRSLMDQRELIPFRALLPKVQMVMISHGVYPQIAPEEASRSPKIIGGLLRGEMGFEGVVVSDDMNMGALPQDRLEWQGALVDALMAGCDMLLVCRGLDRCQWAYEALTQAAQKSKSVTNRLQEASSRMKKLRSLLKS
jgi:beta-N-acetylhexosaminidase